MTFAALEPTPRWELYRVLSEPLRLRLMALAAEEELTIGELAELLSESQPNVSRHVGTLRSQRLLQVRKQGTRVLVQLSDDFQQDPVVQDALRLGQRMCIADGSSARIGLVVAARDDAGRDYFAKAVAQVDDGQPARETWAYLKALSFLLPDRALVVDAGTGDGALLDVLCPVFDHVLAFDREAVQLDRAKSRVARRGYSNVTFQVGSVDDSSLHTAVAARGFADVVIASRFLHHAPKPAKAVKQLGTFLKPGGKLLIVDYAPHDDESMREHADLWLGFESTELCRLAQLAGLVDAKVTPISAEASLPTGLADIRTGRPDAHLPLSILVAQKPGTVAAVAV